MKKLLFVLLAAGWSCSSTPPGVPVLGTLHARYQFPRLPPDGLTALLDRPSENRVCVAEVIGHDTVVKILASGPRNDGEGPPSVLEPVDLTLVDDAPNAEFRAIDADGDGDDELLIRARRLDLSGVMPPPGTPWRERLWIADDCAGTVRQIADVSLPMDLSPLEGDTLSNVRGGGDALAVVLVGINPGWFSYVVDRGLATRLEPCRELSCLPILVEGPDPIVGLEFSAWQRRDGTLALANVGVRVTGHLQSEWYLERRDCRPRAAGYECDPASDWGPVTNAIGRGFLPDERGVTYLRASRNDGVSPARLQSWRSPTETSVDDFDPGSVVWTSSKDGATWRLGAATPEGPFIAEQGSSGARFVGRYDVEGWSPRRPGAWASEVAVHPERPNTLVMLTDKDVDHHIVVQLPRE